VENVLNMPISPTAVGIVIIAVLALCLFKSNKQKGKQTNNQQSKTKTEPAQKVTENKQITPEILAVITAAVASTMQTRNTYRIRTIKRIDMSPNWKMISKSEQIKANN